MVGEYYVLVGPTIADHRGQNPGISMCLYTTTTDKGTEMHGYSAQSKLRCYGP